MAGDVGGTRRGSRPCIQRRSAERTAWFGKLPSEGDFVGRRAAGRLWLNVEEWVTAGLQGLADAHRGDWNARYAASPLWHFVMNEGLWTGAAVIGCVAPSADRFGRCLPIVMLRQFDANRIAEWLPPRSFWLYEVDRLVRRALDEGWSADRVDRDLARLAHPGDDRDDRDDAGDVTGEILSKLGIVAVPELPEKRFAWPELRELFLARPQRSYWWAETSPRLPARRIVHAGWPDAALFQMLFGAIDR